MKRLIVLVVVLMLAVAFVPATVRANDHGWATVGQIFTGVAVAQLLLGGAPAVQYQTVVVPQPVYTVIQQPVYTVVPQPVYPVVQYVAPPVVVEPPVYFKKPFYPGPAVVFAPPPVYPVVYSANFGGWFKGPAFPGPHFPKK